MGGLRAVLKGRKEGTRGDGRGRLAGGALAVVVSESDWGRYCGRQ